MKTITKEFLEDEIKYHKRRSLKEHEIITYRLLVDKLLNGEPYVTLQIVYYKNDGNINYVKYFDVELSGE